MGFAISNNLGVSIKVNATLANAVPRYAEYSPKNNRSAYSPELRADENMNYDFTHNQVTGYLEDEPSVSMQSNLGVHEFRINEFGQFRIKNYPYGHPYYHNPITNYIEDEIPFKGDFRSLNTSGINSSKSSIGVLPKKSGENITIQTIIEKLTQSEIEEWSGIVNNYESSLEGTDKKLKSSKSFDEIFNELKECLISKKQPGSERYAQKAFASALNMLLKKFDINPSTQLKCPITITEINKLDKAVLASDLHIYECEAIESWLNEKDTSPVTREELQGSILLQIKFKKESFCKKVMKNTLKIIFLLDKIRF